MKGRARSGSGEPIDPGLLLRAYSVGVFPMAEARDAGEVFWVEPRQRGVLPLDGFHLSRSLGRTLRRDRFTVTVDHAFTAIVAACAEATRDRPDTWINRQIETAYAALHAGGDAHSIEAWDGGRLVGGLYGVRIGGAFFGESMFSRVTDASKIALAHLVARLRAGGFRLLDCQFLTSHLASLGAIELDRDAYRSLLDAALGFGGPGAGGGGWSPPEAPVADFFALERVAAAANSDPAATVSGPVSGRVIAQLLGQTSQTGSSTTLSEGLSL